MCQQARQAGNKSKAALLIGDLGDVNAIGRRDGFEAAWRSTRTRSRLWRASHGVESEKAQAGLVNALQASPDINFIFSSSDFLFRRSVGARARQIQKDRRTGPRASRRFDGDAMAYRMLVDGYLDATVSRCLF